MDMFVTTNPLYNKLQIQDMYNRLEFQRNSVGNEEFLEMAIAKSSLEIFKGAHKGLEATEIFELLQKGKKKRNVGDAFKHIVNDNWKVDLVVTFNLRSLKNYFTLRDSGSAYFQIQWLAEAMNAQTPSKYLDLIVKPKTS